MAEKVIVDGIGIFEKTFSKYKEPFVKAGHYKCATRKDNDGRKKYVLYSFYDSLAEYPAQIELLSKPVSGLGNPEDLHIEAIMMDDASYLSAIILEPDYYNYLVSHTEEKNGLRYASVDSLICLKVLAFLNLRQGRLRKCSAYWRQEPGTHAVSSCSTCRKSASALAVCPSMLYALACSL